MHLVFCWLWRRQFRRIVKNDGYASRSTDGAKWESSGFHGYSISRIYQPVRYGNGIFAAVGNGLNAFSNSMAAAIKIEPQGPVAPTKSNQAPQTTMDPKERLKELKDLFDSVMITEQ
jgi:hypothetical protein